MKSDYLDPSLTFTVLKLSNAWRINGEDVNLLRQIGQGGFGKVYEANWCDLPVAVKTVSAGSMHLDWSDFENEIALLRTLRHGNIVLFFGAGNFADGEQATVFISLFLRHRDSQECVRTFMYGP